ncbi:hypothetical protein Leryth_016976 [Lithospermum erythrorhizon]|nr:hypothetical protein Leryth_016976 [Lithospermum erythrorhizon]
MPTLLHSCKPMFLLNSSISQNNFFGISKTPKYNSNLLNIISSIKYSSILSNTHIVCCSNNEVFQEFNSTQMTNEELGLLNKPSPNNVEDIGYVVEIENENVKVDKDEILEPFYKFFKASDISEGSETDLVNKESESIIDVEYYEPKVGDSVVGVVVSGNENKLDVNVGADLLGTMLTKEVLPLYGKEMDYLLCDVQKDVEAFTVRGKMGIVMNGESVSEESGSGKPVVEPGTVLFAQVLGRTLSGRPLLSTRRLFRRMAWHRVRQIQQLNEPVLVRITEWNTGGLLCRIEGLRSFLPKADLMNRVNNFTELKENVGRQLSVLITRINEDTNDLILSEKEAWELLNLREGTLLEGTVNKIFPYGAQIRIGESNRSGLLHISKITDGRITSVGDLLTINEKVKVLVVKSMFPGKISLSIVDLESQPGLFLLDKEKVFSEAEEMAKKYRQKKPTVSATRKVDPLPLNGLPFEDEANQYSNWDWFKFE